MNPKAGNVHRDIISDHRFYTATHLGQITSFDPFWGTLVVKKGQKLTISLKVTPTSQKLWICTKKQFLSRDLIISLIQEKYKILTPFGGPHFDVTHSIGYCNFFYFFYGTLRVEWGLKRQNFVHVLATNVLNFQDVNMLKCNSDIDFRLTQ